MGAMGRSIPKVRQKWSLHAEYTCHFGTRAHTAELHGPLGFQIRRNAALGTRIERSKERVEQTARSQKNTKAIHGKERVSCHTPPFNDRLQCLLSAWMLAWRQRVHVPDLSFPQGKRRQPSSPPRKTHALPICHKPGYLPSFMSSNCQQSL